MQDSPSQAKTDCVGRADGSEIASILESSEALYAFSQHKSGDAWIGLEYDPDNNDYQWVDNWPVWYTAWGSGFPKTEGNTKRCVSQQKMENKDTFEWVENDCQTLKGSLCIVRSHKPPMRPIDIEGNNQV